MFDNYEYFDENAIKDEVNTDQYYSGLLTKDSFHLNPLKLTYGLANQCLGKGIKIFENSPIDKIEEKGNDILLFSKNALIKSKKVRVVEIEEELGFLVEDLKDVEEEIGDMHSV